MLNSSQGVSPSGRVSVEIDSYKNAFFVLPSLLNGEPLPQDWAARLPCVSLVIQNVIHHPFTVAARRNMPAAEYASPIPGFHNLSNFCIIAAID